MTEAQYDNLVALMEQFCKVPLLAEFSRPVALLHPELIPIYSKIVKHPIDLGKVCRKLRRRSYKNTRDLQLDMWRIFSNCIKYHTHHSNKDNAVPSFVSISLHLREYFNALWQEFMVSSEGTAERTNKESGPSAKQNKAITKMVEKRSKDRLRRKQAISATYVSSRCLAKTANAITVFLQNGGCVDNLDVDTIMPRYSTSRGEFIDENDMDEDVEEDMDCLMENLQMFAKKLTKRAEAAEENANVDKGVDESDGVGGQADEEYTVEEFVAEYESCFTSNNETLFANRPVLQKRLHLRLDRLIHKILCPIYEANGRGVNQSSIWGCMAAAIWARESSKKPFWPALVLGILAPDDQKEDWHMALTNRNETRLPEKLRSELALGKRRAELALRRQSHGVGEQMSFFLAEFMGTHEFIWVKESDIIENFDPDDDPNTHHSSSGKKKRSSRHHVSDSKTYATAVEEAKWSLEEFELQLQDTCGDLQEEQQDLEDDMEQDMNYDYSVLCQSEEEDSDMDEAEREDEYSTKDKPMSLSDIEEADELLATEGLLDFTVAGRKEAKKRLAARKKQKADAEKAALRKEKSEQAKKKKAAKAKAKATQSKGTKATSAAANKESKKALREEKKEQREIDKRRRKRARERERVLKEEMRKKKRRRTSGPAAESRVIHDKRGRATAIIRGYLTRMFAKQQAIEDNVAAIPASVVDSSGLLGMALAFRAAAGEIALPANTGDASFEKHAPWDKIDSDSLLTSAERTANLEKQMKLLEEEIAKVKMSTERRKQLTKEALETKETVYDKILDSEKTARKSHLKKRKKYIKGGSKKSVGNKEKQTSEKPKDGESENAEADKAPEDDTSTKEIESLKQEDEDEDDSKRETENASDSENEGHEEATADADAEDDQGHTHMEDGGEDDGKPESDDDENQSIKDETVDKMEEVG
mmetsp:Transcript_24276/g.34203  ORF Transcript_24276/g.34203 Transcript_24276/m.34203 type:complete len:932 (+) Transcript_24276:449-3244(+)